MKNSGGIISSWSINQSLGFLLGWFFHGLVSHLFTGEHGLQLSPVQFFMHNVSLAGMVLILLCFQNRATTSLFGFSILKYWLVYLLVSLTAFWIGYYALGMPVDLVFIFIALSLLNGIYIRKQLPLKRWLLFSFLSAIIGIVIGTIIATPVEPLLAKGLDGWQKHMVIFLVEGTAVGVPMAISGGLMLRASYRKAGLVS